MRKGNNMVVFAAIVLSFLLKGLVVQAQQSRGNDSVLLFSYFKNNGEDGLHLAWSKDGYRFTALKGDSSFLQPLLSKDKLMRDPCIITGADGLFHMVWTVSWNEKGIGYASSSDLVHWSKQQYLPVMESEKGALNCWAPEIFYDKPGQQYMIYWSTTIPGRFLAGTQNGDEKYNHRIYYVTTKDFKKFSRTKLLYNQGFNVIDGTIQHGAKGYWMVLKDETLKPAPQKNLRLAFSKRLTGGYGKPSAPITGNYWAEGPTAIRLEQEWVVYFDKYMDHLYGAVSTVDWVNWKDISEKIHFPEGARHGTVLKISAEKFSALLQ